MSEQGSQRGGCRTEGSLSLQGGKQGKPVRGEACQDWHRSWSKTNLELNSSSEVKTG